jgi:ABC-2 type transport system ATP-binding protein
MITLAGVSVRYGRASALAQVSTEVPAGAWLGIIGPNGAGKSTLLHLMAGFLPPSRGQLTVGGQPAWRNPGLYREAGLVTERDTAYGFLTGEQYVLAVAQLHGLPDPGAATRRAIGIVEMAGAAGRRIGTYSKGMRQRMKVAAALVHDPGTLLLDEPFNGMDPRQRLQLMDLLHRLGAAGRTVLLSSHILEEVERLSGTIQVIVAGRLAASGDYRAIRRLMTSRPHLFLVRTSDDRGLAAALVARPAVTGVELTRRGLSVQAADYGTFTRELAAVTRERGIRLRELMPADESLESVFAYLAGAGRPA